MTVKTLLAAAIAATAFALPAVAQDVANGEDVFKKCRACHRVGPDAKNLVGPQLNGIVGRKAGTVEGFKYSPANQKAATDGLMWTEENLDKYLADPRGFMPGNKMAFAGVKDDKDRKDLIAYLKAQK